MNKSPFTATQWQELEHQALVFKYMVSGIPVPPDLLFTLKTSYLDSISHHPPQHIGSWNCFQMGLGRKIDPEPGRCRRTDGKKWRCSKEAFPESKYCERHMHRGKNRSRKPVEVSKPPSCCAVTSSTLTNSLAPSMLAKNNNNNNNNTSLVSSDHHTQNRHSFHYYPPCYNNGNVNNAHLVDQNPNNTTSLLFDSDVRYVYGMKEEVDEHAFFSEEPSSRTLRDQFSSASSMDDSWQLTPLTISCSSSSKQTRNERSYYSHNAKLDNHDRTQQRCDRREDQTQKTIHFFDERPIKVKDSWLDLDDKSSNTTTGSVFSTQLSISMPRSSSYDFPIFSSRTRNGD